MLKPYKKLNLSIEKNILKAKLPWVSFDCEIEENKKKEVENVFNLFPSSIANPLFQEFLDQFEDNTIFYRSPRQNLATAIQKDSHKKQTTNTNQCLEFRNLKDESQYREGLFDPLTIYGILRGELLELDVQNRENYSIYALLNEQLDSSEALFFKSLSLLLQQTYHITKNFCPTLEANTSPFEVIIPFIERIYREEKGHHKLIENSLFALKTLPKESLVFPETRDLISLVGTALRTCPLTFALLFDFLEGDGYTETDPLVDIIEKTSRPECGLGLKKHFEINRNEQHNKIGLEIAYELPALNLRDLEIAYKTFSTMKQVLEKFARELFKNLKALKS